MLAISSYELFLPDFINTEIKGTQSLILLLKNNAKNQLYLSIQQ